ncbi:MAG: hypothetical protein LUO99_01235 [Methanomicrobiales archaeon]|nr:hypothetical protein [Methanomicrobiales archaeon]
MAAWITLPGTLATGVGALPHRDPAAACDTVLRIFPEFPFAPTLPNRGLQEQIVIMDSEPLPGRVIAEGRLTVDREGDLSRAMEQIYLDYLEKDAARYGPSPAYASGFHEMMGRRLPAARFLKCQVTGPVTFGMQVVDRDRKPIAYDPQYADILPKMMGLRARFSEQEMRRRTGVKETLVVLNEPYLATLGSSVVPVDPGWVRSGWEEMAAVVDGGLGVHCCANTDWGFVLSLDPSVLSLDAFGTGREVLLYLDQITAYLERGGVIAWGIVPADAAMFAREPLESLYGRYRAIRDAVTARMDPEVFDSHSLITPTCGIQGADEATAVRIMETAAAIAGRVRGAE